MIWRERLNRPKKSTGFASNPSSGVQKSSPNTGQKHMLGICWVVPLPSNSDHQDCFMFRIGDPNLNLHLPLESWEGGQLKVYEWIMFFSIFFRGFGNFFFFGLGHWAPGLNLQLTKKVSHFLGEFSCHLWGPDFLGLASKND